MSTDSPMGGFKGEIELPLVRAIHPLMHSLTQSKVCLDSDIRNGVAGMRHSKLMEETNNPPTHTLWGTTIVVTDAKGRERRKMSGQLPLPLWQVDACNWCIHLSK